MSGHDLSLLDSFRGRDVVLDTNLSLLHLASFQPEMIKRWSFVASNFGYEDARLLAECLKCFKQVVSTPHIVAEISHFFEDLGEESEKFADDAFSRLERAFASIDERFFPASLLLREHRKIVNEHGIIDAVQFHLAKADSACLLSTDGSFVSRAQSAGLAAVNFNYLRGLDS